MSDEESVGNAAPCHRCRLHVHHHLLQGWLGLVPLTRSASRTKQSPRPPRRALRLFMLSTVSMWLRCQHGRHCQQESHRGGEHRLGMRFSRGGGGGLITLTGVWVPSGWRNPRGCMACVRLVSMNAARTALIRSTRIPTLHKFVPAGRRSLVREPGAGCRWDLHGGSLTATLMNGGIEDEDHATCFARRGDAVDDVGLEPHGVG